MIIFFQKKRKIADTITNQTIVELCNKLFSQVVTCTGCIAAGRSANSLR